MGLVGLMLAKVFQLPLTASYHTEVPALINLLGGSPFLERVGRSYLRWFYGQVDRVFCFSSTSRDTLRGLGVAPERIHLVPQTVDPGEFSPRHRSDEIFEQLWNRTVAGYNDTEDAVNLIIAAVDAADPRPIWYSDWGTDHGGATNNLRRALDRVWRGGDIC